MQDRYAWIRKMHLTQWMEETRERNEKLIEQFPEEVRHYVARQFEEKVRSPSLMHYEQAARQEFGMTWEEKDGKLTFSEATRKPYDPDSWRYLKR